LIFKVKQSKKSGLLDLECDGMSMTVPRRSESFTPTAQRNIAEGLNPLQNSCENLHLRTVLPYKELSMVGSKTYIAYVPNVRFKN
jgi:hypothetical protein